MRRRAVLGTLSAATLSGCLGTALERNSSTAEDESSRKTADEGRPANRERLCTDDSRLQAVEEVQYGTADVFSMAADSDCVSVGETLTVRMTNGAWSDRTIATRDHYDVQRATSDGWRSVYTLEPNAVFGELGRVFEARDSIAWRLRLTRAGLVNDISAKSAQAVVCSALEPGQYRFVFFGLDDPVDTDLSVRFELPPAPDDDRTGSDSPA